MSNQHEVQATKEQLQEAIEMRDALHRLLSNKDFKALVTDGYIRDEALRLTKLLGDASVRASEKTYAATVDELKAIGMLDNHFRMVQQIGNNAAATLAEYEQAELSGAFDEDDDE